MLLSVSFGLCLAASDPPLLPILKSNVYFCRLHVAHRAAVPKIPEKQAAERRPEHPSKLAVRAPKSCCRVAAATEKKAAIRTSKLRIILRFEEAGLWECSTLTGIRWPHVLGLRVEI